MAAMQVPGPSRTTQEIATMSPWNKEALKSMRKVLGGVYMDAVMIKELEKSDIPSPANLGFLSREQLQVVEAEKTPAGQMKMVIDYLLEMEDKYFECFCKLLEQSNFAGKAKMLREKAESLKRFVDSGATVATPIVPRIKADYVTIKRTLVRVCTTKKLPTLEQVKDFCFDLLECAFKNVPQMSGHMNEIVEATTMEDTMRIVCFRLSNWLNYDFLNMVIDEFQPALESITDKLTCYENKLKPLLLQKLRHIAELQQRQDAPQTMAELIVKYSLNADGLVVKDLLTEKYFLAQRLSIPPHLLQVLSWRPGSVSITYWIVRDVLPLVELALCRTNVRAELIKHGVEAVYLDSHPLPSGPVDQSLQNVHLQRRAIVAVIDAHHEDLDVNSLASDLKDMGILTTEQCQKLTSLDEDRKHDALLYILLSHKGPDTYHRTVEYMGERDASIAAELQATFVDLMKSPGALSVIDRSQFLPPLPVNLADTLSATPPAHSEGAAQTETNPAAGESCLSKRSPEGALQHLSPAKRVVRCALTGSEGSVEAVGVSSSAQVVSGGAVAAERSSPICEATFAQVIQDHTEEFLQEMNAKEIAPKLKEYKLIPEPVEFDILQSKSKELANICLLRHLKEDAAEEAAMKVFRIASEMTSYGKMNTFAAGVLRKLQRGEHSQRKRSPEGAQQDQPPAKTVVRCNLTESEGSVEVVDVSGSAPAVSRGADAAESGPPICEATPPTQPEGAAQTETNPAAGSSTVFAVITANPTEENAVRHFLQLGGTRGEVWEGAHECVWKNDPYLKSNDITVTYTSVDKDYGYEFFTLTREGSSEKVVGVHTKCLQQAAHTDGGAQDTATTLLHHAKEWPLKVLFSVGCCSYADDSKCKENLMGYVLLANQFNANLHRGKMAKGTIQHHPEVYRADQKWMSDLQDHRITKPARQSGTDAQSLVKFKDIPVKEVPRIESVPMVVKSDEDAQVLRGVSYRSGIEMEAVGFIRALNSYERQGNQNIPKFASVKCVSDSGSGKHRKAETTFFGEKTSALPDDERQLVATLHSIALVIRGVVERYLV